ncbi:MAG: glucans biosynthesis glucosyltransferase MdoH [Dongiaceae bacterium]
MTGGPAADAAPELAAPAVPAVAGLRLPPSSRGRRWSFWAFIALSTGGFGTLFLAGLLPGGISLPELLLMLLFLPLFACLSVSFWIAAVGAWLGLGFGGARRAALPVPAAAPSAAAPSPAAPLRTAIVMPIHNEEPARAFAGLRATWDSLAAAGAASDGFDLFVLSDSTDPDRWAEEVACWDRLVRETGAAGRIFYRRRPANRGRKAGNIADFCERWGGRYDHLVVLDADSLMSGPALLALAGMMAATPRAGIIQTLPRLQGARTLFGRLHQFAHNLYAPLFLGGAAYLQLADGSYLGHNAIIRLAPFLDHCRLPLLPGRPPLGGEILSHDSVEAALMRRAGWEVWLVPDLPGSWEAGPPTLIDYARRDQRWCAGNMQHLRVLLARGLTFVSRAQLGMGALSYGLAPLCLAFMLLSLLTADQRGEAAALAAASPLAAAAGPALIAAAATLLFLPKLLGLCVAARRDGLAQLGGPARGLAGVALEIAVTTLLAPVIMAGHCQSIARVAAGRMPRWEAQRRDGGRAPLGTLLRAHAGHTLLGVGAGLLASLAMPGLQGWLVPAVAGLVLAVPVSALTASARAGGWSRRAGLLLTAAETAPAPECVAFAGHLARYRDLEAAAGPGFRRAVLDPRLNALFRGLLPRPAPGPSSLAVRQLVRRCERQGLGALDGLAAADRLALLSDAAALARLHDHAWTRAPLAALAA